MNEKEMIEEMAEIIFNSKYKNDYISPLKGANELYNAGYRKPPEGSVVLTKEEYINDFCSQFDKGYKIARKETAKEIFAQIDKNLRECTIVNEGGYGWNYQGYEATDLRKRLTKLAKQYGVGIKE